MKDIKEYSQEIEQAITQLQFPEGELKGLYEPIKYAMSAGGKRLRPVLTLMGADAFLGNYEQAIKPALGLEMFHNFTLLHDDVMDKSDMRRGRPTVHKKYNENTAILSGDTMLTLATQYISEVPDKILREIIETFNSMAIKVYEGQQLDIDFETMESISPEQYLRMIEYKTGALLGASVMIGALIGNADKKDATLLYEYGKNIGISFQIQDDYLDTFGDATKFGKPIGGDINNAKKTFLYVEAFATKPEMAEALKNAYNIPAGNNRVNTVTKLYEKMNMPDKCRQEVNKYLGIALQNLNETSLNKESKEKFHLFAEKLIGRKK